MLRLGLEPLGWGCLRKEQGNSLGEGGCLLGRPGEFWIQVFLSWNSPEKEKKSGRQQGSLIQGCSAFFLQSRSVEAQSQSCTKALNRLLSGRPGALIIRSPCISSAYGQGVLGHDIVSMFGIAQRTPCPELTHSRVLHEAFDTGQAVCRNTWRTM